MVYKIMKDLNKSDKSKYKRYWDSLELAWRLAAMLDMDFPCMFEKKTITSLRLLLRTDAKRFVEQPVEFRQFCSQDLDTKHG